MVYYAMEGEGEKERERVDRRGGRGLMLTLSFRPGTECRIRGVVEVSMYIASRCSADALIEWNLAGVAGK